MKYTYFSGNDFLNANPPCHIDDMDSLFLSRLDSARHISGVPFVVLSAYRSPEHEESKGRRKDGVHPTGKAIDIRATKSRERFLILDSLIKVGFTRIGIYDWGFHVDMCEDIRDEKVIWK